MTVRTEAGLSGRHIGRYVLEDLVTESGGAELWRALDPALRRPVCARLISLDDPRVEDLRVAAQRAASVHDRRLVPVLDVVEAQGCLAVITEWVAGDPWSDLLTERWSAQEAAVVALEVGRALESAHKSGVTHGRLRPDSLMITDAREVRLRGLGTEAALWGVDPAGDAHAADLHGVGAVLYAGLTRRWPSDHRGPIDGLAPAPTVNGVTQAPGTVAPDIPASLDEVVARSLISGEPPAGTRSYSDVSECVAALERAYGTIPGYSAGYAEGTDTKTDRIVGRLSTVAVLVLAVAGVVLLLWQLLANRVSEAGAPSGEAAAVVQPLPTVDTPIPEAPFAVVKAWDFDPYGDQSEGGESIRNSVDANRGTAWYTDAYGSADLNGKGGVGLVLDLGAVRPVRAIDLKLVGVGTDFVILTSKKKPAKMKDFRPVVDVTAAGDAITVRTPRARDARFVMVWLKRLPFDGANYVGGIRDVKVVG